MLRKAETPGLFPNRGDQVRNDRLLTSDPKEELAGFAVYPHRSMMMNAAAQAKERGRERMGERPA